MLNVRRKSLLLHEKYMLNLLNSSLVQTDLDRDEAVANNRIRFFHLIEDSSISLFIW